MSSQDETRLPNSPHTTTHYCYTGYVQSLTTVAASHTATSRRTIVELVLGMHGVLELMR